MKYYSLNKSAPEVDFAQAAVEGQAPDKGLYFPVEIPKLDQGFINNIENISDAEIAYTVIRPYVGGTIADERLFEIVSQTIDFPIPLVPVTDRISSLELFHGPTLAFKDIGARFMSRCLGEFVAAGEQKKVVVLVATSGDTGGAVADGFYDVPGINVIILYPSGKVSPVQELQLTALGKNIQALEINGNFDDCQSMVKKAFADKDINNRLFLTSANSINIARWLPQQFYYFFAYKQWKQKHVPPVISVPSGNFGNLCAGVLAACSGLPAKHFIAACNSNDVVPVYFETGNYLPKTPVPTYSNAMDVGDPSNFWRLITMMESAKNISISATSVSDDVTKETIRRVYDEFSYVLDPHGAVAYHALDKYLALNPGDRGLFLETAHPVKFPEIVESTLGMPIELPAQISGLMHRKKQSTRLPASFGQLKEYLMQNNFSDLTN